MDKENCYQINKVIERGDGSYQVFATYFVSENKKQKILQFREKLEELKKLMNEIKKV